MTLVETVKRWIGMPQPTTPEPVPVSSEALLEHQAYWRGFNDGRRQTALSYLLSGDAAKVTRA